MRHALSPQRRCLMKPHGSSNSLLHKFSSLYNSKYPTYIQGINPAQNPTMQIDLLDNLSCGNF